MGFKQDWSLSTWWLTLSVVAFSFGDLLFGIDTAAFGAIQVLPSWLLEFGDYNAETDTYFNPTTRTSLMNAIVFLGAFVGCGMFEPICSRWGYKITIYCAAALQVVAVIVELTAPNWEAFTAGRVVAYIGVGLVQNASPGYCSEVSPSQLRGFMNGTMTVIATIGNVIGVGVSVPYTQELGRIGWIVPVAIQFIPAIGIMATVPFCPESPRWLLMKGRDTQALAALGKLRGKDAVSSGSTVREMEAIKAEIEYMDTLEKGRWVDLFVAKYRKRTIMVVALFFFYQTSGGQFSNVYGPTFYRQIGFGDDLFVYQTVGQAIGVVLSLAAIISLDVLGRRPIIMFGAMLLVVCNVIIGSIGPKSSYTSAEEGVVVASIMLLLSGTKISFQMAAYLFASEVGGNRMRKKFMSFCTCVDIIIRFVFILIVPYLIRTPGLNLGARLGFVMGFIALCGTIFVFFVVPETKGKSLEEMDELFAMRLWPWQWHSAVTSGVGSAVARAEQKDSDMEKEPEIEHDDLAMRNSIPTSVSQSKV